MWQTPSGGESVTDPGLVVIRQPRKTMGQIAANTLLQKIHSDQSFPSLISLEPEIVNHLALRI
jgi:DNA-binding LacI/PurR family transcriptional regulator